MTPAREALLRTHTGGRMLTSSVNGVEMAPLWSSVPNLTMWWARAGVAELHESLDRCRS
jgi:hypothetical protein